MGADAPGESGTTGSEVEPGDLAELTLTYTDGKPVITARGGTTVPRNIPLVDESGAQLARYTVVENADSEVIAAKNYQPDTNQFWTFR